MAATVVEHPRAGYTVTSTMNPDGTYTVVETRDSDGKVMYRAPARARPGDIAGESSNGPYAGSDQPIGSTVDWENQHPSVLRQWSPEYLHDQGFSLARPLEPGETPDYAHLVAHHGLTWDGWPMEDIQNAAVGAMGEMSNLYRSSVKEISGELADMAGQRADYNIERFPAVSGRALGTTMDASRGLYDQMTSQFFGALDSLVPGWQDKITGSAADISGMVGNISNGFMQKIMPEVSYRLAESTALVNDAASSMLNGQLPMGVMNSVIAGAPGAYRNSSAAGRMLSARDLGISSQQLNTLGLQAAGISSSLIPTVAQGFMGIAAAPAAAAAQAQGIAANFMPQFVNSAGMYGQAMQGLMAGGQLSADKMYAAGMQSYANTVSSGMQLFGTMQELAAAQQASWNDANKAGNEDPP